VNHRCGSVVAHPDLTKDGATSRLAVIGPEPERPALDPQFSCRRELLRRVGGAGRGHWAGAVVPIELFHLEDSRAG
jgi:hypothetical protein